MFKFGKMTYSLLIVAMTALISGYFTEYGISSWYAVLEKPAVTPPNFVFPIMWTILYLLMAFSFYLIQIKAEGSQYVESTRLFFSQLLLQIIWCFAFFYMGFLALALGVIIILDIVVWIMLKNFKKTDNLAGNLLYPYWFWILFATYLNLAFVYHNGFVV